MSKRIHDRWSYLWLAIAVLFGVVANGFWIIPIATWLFPVFFIRFLRTQNVVRGILIGAPAWFIICIIGVGRLLYTDFMPPEAPFLFSIGGLIFFLAFLADRIITPRINGFISTLVFPLAWGSIEYLSSLSNGTFGAIAYTQYGNLSLMQLVSVTGIWGIAFLVGWFASTINWAWEHKSSGMNVQRGLIIYASVLILVLLFGGARLVFFSPEAKTVSVGSIANPEQSFVSRFFAPEFEDREAIHKVTIKEQQDFFKRSKEVSHKGAKIVLWQEYAVSCLKEDEPAFLTHGSELAQQEGIYLLMAYSALPKDFPHEPWKNKQVWIDPSGNIVHEYYKSKPVPMLEPIEPGDGKVPVVDTPYGKIASVICFDADFPYITHQAGRAGADLLLISSYDWKEIDPLHTRMSIFRAIENGLSMVRTTGHGMSAAVDSQGRILNALDFWKTDKKVMISHVPIRGVPTVYARIGDLFAWLCIAGFAIITLWTLLKRKNKS
jgi:apolipoprotein N-acyltransferase